MNPQKADSKKGICFCFYIYCDLLMHYNYLSSILITPSWASIKRLISILNYHGIQRDKTNVKNIMHAYSNKYEIDSLLLRRLTINLATLSIL